MSHFYTDAIHLETGETRRALFMDGYFGGHRYGVRFDGEEKVWREEEVKEPEKPGMSKLQKVQIAPARQPLCPFRKSGITATPQPA